MKRRYICCAREWISQATILSIGVEETLLVLAWGVAVLGARVCFVGHSQGSTSLERNLNVTCPKR